MQRLISVFIALAAAHAAGAWAQSSPYWNAAAQPWIPYSVTSASDASVMMSVVQGPHAMRSTDGGATWSPFLVSGARPDEIAASPTHPRVFYAVVEPPFGASESRPSVLYRSDDAGATWSVVNGRLVLASTGHALGGIRVGAEPSTLYAKRLIAGICFIGCSYSPADPYFVSNDSGLTWRSLVGDLPGSGQRIFPSFSNSQVLYAHTATALASEHRLYRSVDGGKAWQLIRRFPASTPITEVVADRVDPLTVYVRVRNGTDVLVSEDAGATWRDEPMVDLAGTSRSLIADPVDAGRVFFVSTEGKVLESRDRARTWKRVAPATDRLIDAAAVRIAANGASRILLAPSFFALHTVQIPDAPLVLGSDLWWNPAEPGSGFTIIQHASGRTFIVWYTYDAQGAPRWYVMPGGTWTGARTFSGSLYATTGPGYFNAFFLPSAVQASGIGSAEITFEDDNRAVFSYRLATGAHGESRITRQFFGPREVEATPDYSDLWWKEAESGWGIAVNQQFGRVFATWFVYDVDGTPLWLVMPDARKGTAPKGVQQRFQGNVYATRRPAFGAAYDPAGLTVLPVGSATLDFTSRDRGSLSYSAMGANGLREITRQPF
jgi:photosystem II stability/assembly factor-like uncharacterized protein